MFLRSDIFQAITLKNANFPPLSYWCLVLLRFLLTACPQTGYIHPDEYFQNVEVVAGDIFTIDVAKTWEFNPKFPIRNIFVPKLIFGPPLYLIRIINPFTKYYFNFNLRNPYYLLVLPRLFICLLSFVNDYCLYKICILYGQNFKRRLTVFASSYIILVYACRGFSNTFEITFFSLLLFFVAKCMAKSDKVIYHEEFLNEKYEKATTPVEKVKLFKLKSHLPEHSLNHVVAIATLTVVGIFNRPTFVGFAFPPIFFWLHRGLGSKVVGFKDFHYRIFMLFLCGTPTVLLLILVDSVYYGYLTLADIESLKISWDNWVVTPLNFVRYNLDQRNLKHHGLHPHWMHLAVNVPLLFNVLGVFACIALSINLYRFLRGQYSKLPRIQSITGLMLFSLVIPMALLSMFPHQEARFIIPVLLPLVFLYGNYFQTNESNGSHLKRLKKILLYSWYILNGLLTIFFGFIHQGGVYPFIQNLHYEIKASYGVHTHVITTHTYSIPTFLLQLDSTSVLRQRHNSKHKYRLSPQTFIYKYGSLPLDDLFYKIDEILTNAEMLLHEYKKPYNFYVASPCPLHDSVMNAARAYFYFELVEEYNFYPHFCTEAPPKFPQRHEQRCLAQSIHVPRNQSSNVDLNMFQRISCYMKNFCFKVYRVNVLHKYDYNKPI